MEFIDGLPTHDVLFVFAYYFFLVEADYAIHICHLFMR